MLHQLSLHPVSDARIRHVRAGAVVRVLEAHEVPTGTRIVQHVRVLEGVDDRHVHPLPVGQTVTAHVGDLAVELRDARTQELVTHAYLAGPAVQCHRHPQAVDAERAWFEPARVERLSQIERFVEELGTEAPPDRIEELKWMAIAAMQRVRHSDVDVALLDVEAGDQYRRAISVISDWWNSELPPPEPRAASLRTCHLLARAVRSRKLDLLATHARFRRAPAIAYLHAQPQRHGGWQPAAVFHMRAVLEATLAS